MPDIIPEKAHAQQVALQNYGDATEAPYQLRGGSPNDHFERGLRTEDILIGNGWLERGSAFWLVAQSGVGKSQAILQICICWACGKGGAYAFFLEPYDGRALRIVIIQNRGPMGAIARGPQPSDQRPEAIKAQIKEAKRQEASAR
jgi:AAA domain-containing protein